VLPFFLLIDTRATVAFPNLLLGVVQAAIACLVVVKALEIAGALVGGGKS
jgi:hypothetical protein